MFINIFGHFRNSERGMYSRIWRRVPVASWPAAGYSPTRTFGHHGAFHPLASPSEWELLYADLLRVRLDFLYVRMRRIAVLEINRVELWTHATCRMKNYKCAQRVSRLFLFPRSLVCATWLFRKRKTARREGVYIPVHFLSHPQKTVSSES